MTLEELQNAAIYTEEKSGPLYYFNLDITKFGLRVRGIVRDAEYIYQHNYMIDWETIKLVPYSFLIHEINRAGEVLQAKVEKR